MDSCLRRVKDYRALCASAHLRMARACRAHAELVIVCAARRAAFCVYQQGDSACAVEVPKEERRAVLEAQLVFLKLQITNPSVHQSASQSDARLFL